MREERQASTWAKLDSQKKSESTFDVDERNPNAFARVSQVRLVSCGKVWCAKMSSDKTPRWWDPAFLEWKGCLWFPSGFFAREMARNVHVRSLR